MNDNCPATGPIDSSRSPRHARAAVSEENSLVADVNANYKSAREFADVFVKGGKAKKR